MRDVPARHVLHTPVRLSLSASTLVRHALVPPLLSHLSPTESVVNPGPRQRHACPFQLGGAVTVR